MVGILLVGSMLLAALASDEVETAAVNLVTSEISRAMGTNASVGAVEYRFPARVAVRDVYIEDLQGDTLLYAGELYVHFSPIRLVRNEIIFRHVRVRDVYANIYSLPDSTWNYSFLLPLLKSDPKKEDMEMSGLLSVRDVRLENIRLRYEDYRAQLTHASMDLNHLTSEELDAQITDLAMDVTNGETLSVESMKAHVILNDTMLAFPTLSARLPRSKLDISGMKVRFPAGDTLYLSKSAQDIHFGLIFHEAELVPADVALLVPGLRRVNRAVTLNGTFGGTLDSLYLKT